MTQEDIQAERLDEAEELFTRLLAMVVQPDEDFSSSSFAALLKRINRWLRKREEDTQ